LTPEQLTEISAMNVLRMVNFTNCTINKPSSQKFLLKNLSGISTKFELNSLNFEPVSHTAPQEQNDIRSALEAENKLQRQQTG